MALDDAMVQQGNWLFRWRSYLPLLLLLPLMAAMPRGEGASGPLLEGGKVACLLVSLLGLGLRTVTTGFAAEGTSGRSTRRHVAQTLNTTGPYSVVRNPLYLGNFLIWLGLALFCLVWWLAVLYVLAFWLYYERIILAEEAFLRQKFGEHFERWAAQTPAFFPRFSRWTPAAVPFSWRRVLRKEHSGLLGIAVAFFALNLLEHLLREQRLVFQTGWTVLLVIALLVSAVLRTLKKRTPWLRAPASRELRLAGEKTA